MNLLFVDHECHKKTGSAAFFLNTLRQLFEVAEHYYSQYYKTGAANVVQGYDGVIVWEFPLSRRRFFFPGKRNVFVPMYDNEWASYWQWKRIAWSGMGVISFCEKVSRHARRCGVTNLLDVRYFPDPCSFPQVQGNPKRVFLWERGQIGRDIAERLFPRSSGYELDVKGANEFLSREAYFERIAKCGIVLAPRCKEGIGMAFLEAMAMGKCVVANDDATMNEYIVDGENGILFSLSDTHEIDKTVVDRIHAKVGRFCKELRAGWVQDSARINEFIAIQRPVTLSLVSQIKLVLSYPLYLAEGFLHVISTMMFKGD